VRGAVQQIRNEVVHYHSDALDKIALITGFENDKLRGNYCDTLFAGQLRKEKANAPKAFASQLKTGGVLACYPLPKLETFFNSHTFSLYRSVVPFAPGFKKVMTGGVNYQNATRDKRFYDLELSAYKAKEDFGNEDAWNARYFLLKTIYNNLFLPGFTDNGNRDHFRKTVNSVLDINKKQAKKTGNIHAQAFDNVREMNEDESINTYMAYVQSNLILEQNKKEEAGATNAEVRINVEKFVRQVFIKGFDCFLIEPSLAFIQKPESELAKDEAGELNRREKQLFDACHIDTKGIDDTNPLHIAIYTFCKLLSAVHLNNLHNELTKYHTAGDTARFSYLTAIIELCMLSADNVPQAASGVQDNYLSHFLEQDATPREFGDLYVQSDGAATVVHAPVEISRKYGTFD
jgi:hypothetical protein